jgi:hypothetical protein
MPYEYPPVVGNWYRRLDRSQEFQVVAYDADADTVDVEYFDGTIDEWPIAHWHALEIEPCEPPQDWTGPYDDIERDDLGGDMSDMAPEDWHEPFEGPQDAADRSEIAAQARLAAPAHVGARKRRRAAGRSGG